MKRLIALSAIALSATAALTGCAVGDRGLETVHQPVVSATEAVVPGCPSWNHEVGGERESQSSNFGCATMTNLASMVADPADLLHGRGDPTNADVSVKAIKAMREAAATSKIWTTTVSQTTAGGGK